MTHDELRKAALDFRKIVHEILAADAVCDHSVGICWCGYHHALEALDDALGPQPLPKNTS